MAARLLDLPAELVHHILTYLEARDLARVSTTCQALHILGYDNKLWEALINEHLPPTQRVTPLHCTFREIYAAHHPYWFLVSGKIWFGDSSPNGQLLLTRYDAETGCITGHTMTAIRGGHTLQFWERDRGVIIHSFEPNVSLDLNRPAIKLGLDTFKTAAHRHSPRTNRYSEEVEMPIEADPGLQQSLMLCNKLSTDAITAQTQVWPPLRFPSTSRARTESSSGFQSLGHVPSRWSEVNHGNFRIHKWVQYTGRGTTTTRMAHIATALGELTGGLGRNGNFFGMAGGLYRFPESITTYATLPASSYTPTKQKPWQGIWCGDYSGHGCEFLVITQPDKKDEQPLPEKLGWLREWLRGGRRGQRDSSSSNGSYASAYEDFNAMDEDTLAEIDDSDSTEESTSTSEQAESSDTETMYSGRLEAIKLTGDPNIPRGEYTFLAPDIGSKGFVRIAEEEPFRGARVIRSAGHIAGAGFREDQYTPSQLIMISHDRLAQFWEGFGHISFYQRVDMDALMTL